jgi:hypothetical protein
VLRKPTVLKLKVVLVLNAVPDGLGRPDKDVGTSASQIRVKFPVNLRFCCKKLITGIYLQRFDYLHLAPFAFGVKFLFLAT